MSVIFFSHEASRWQAPAVVPSMVKKHQPSNETCLGYTRGGWAKIAKLALQFATGLQAQCVRGDAQSASENCAAIDYCMVAGFPA
ncbi:MAG: hypothetical protein O9331_16515, partial [Acidovorax sp.]|nr:hypothetical protein [Acidovorax sp.]